MERRMVKKQHPKDDPEQYKRFLEAAKEAEADETEAGANRAFKKVALPKKTTKDQA
jgi:Mg-chelatase subunit ChlI